MQLKEPPTPEPSAPKLVVVAGSSTHVSGGPTHHLEPAESYNTEPHPTPSRIASLRGVWTDVADDLGIPRDISLGVTQRAQRSRVEDLPQETSRTTGQSEFHSRNLDRDERRGVWVFLGLLGGSWLLGGALATGSAFAEDTAAKQTPEAHKA